MERKNLKLQKSYYEELEQNQAQIAVHNRVFCKNSILNAVLNAKYNLAQEQQIDCFFHIDLQKLIGCDSLLQEELIHFPVLFPLLLNLFHQLWLSGGLVEEVGDDFGAVLKRLSCPLTVHQPFKFYGVDVDKCICTFDA